MDEHFTAGHIQQSPLAQTGAQSLTDFLAWAKRASADAHHHAKRMSADSDHVIAHVHGMIEPGTRGNAVIVIGRNLEIPGIE